MNKSTLRKTLLAASIAASTQVYAASGVSDLTKDVSGSSEVNFELTDHANVTLTGDAQRTAGEDGVGFDGAKIRGNLVNNANIYASGNYVAGMDIDIANDVDATKTEVAGDIVNNGTLQMTGQGALGIAMEGSNANSLINNGTIDVLDESDGSSGDHASGIELVSSTLNGGLVNAGTIKFTGEAAKGITAYSSGQGVTSIGGDIENRGNISVSGTNAIGIELDDVSFGHSVINNGGMVAAGINATTVLVDDTKYNSLVNNGGLYAAARVPLQSTSWIRSARSKPMAPPASSTLATSWPMARPLKWAAAKKAPTASTSTSLPRTAA